MRPAVVCVTRTEGARAATAATDRHLPSNGPGETPYMLHRLGLDSALRVIK